MRRRKKGFEYGEGTYYFTVKSTPNNITMHRKNKAAAIDTFRHYQSVGKDVEWHGKWNGKSFEESGIE